MYGEEIEFLESLEIEQYPTNDEQFLATEVNFSAQNKSLFVFNKYFFSKRQNASALIRLKNGQSQKKKHS